MSDSAQVLVTGRFWLGADGARAIGPALTELISEARQEIIIVAYRLTIAHEGLRRSLESALVRGCYLKVILDDNEAPDQSERLFFQGLLNKYSNLTVWDFRESEGPARASLHAKLVIVDRSAAIVGSANFSKNGLIENHEVAILLKGKVARSLSSTVDALIRESLRGGTLAKRGGEE